MHRLLVLATFAVSLVPAQQLKYAVIVSRHGVRAPTWTPERLNAYSAAPWPDFGVPPAHLTPHGRKLIVEMGNFYRAHFTALGLLGKPACADAKATYIWADTDQRTLETGKAFAESLTPGCKLEIHSLKPDESDPLFDPTSTGLAKRDPALSLAAVQGRIGPDVNALIDANRPAFDTLTYILNGRGKAKKSIFDAPLTLATTEDGVDLTGPLRTASTFTENLLLEYTNGMTGDQLGWGRLNPANLQQIMSLHTSYADLIRRTPYLARVRGSNLLSSVVQSLRQATTGAPGLKVISGHDTNISNLSGMLNLSWQLPSYQKDDIAPGGALLFSLWRTGATYQVRLQVVTQTMDQMHNLTPLSLAQPPVVADVFIPGCSTAAAGYPCDWQSFERAAAAVIFPNFTARPR